MRWATATTTWGEALLGFVVACLGVVGFFVCVLAVGLYFRDWLEVLGELFQWATR